MANGNAAPKAMVIGASKRNREQRLARQDLAERHVGLGDDVGNRQQALIDECRRHRAESDREREADGQPDSGSRTRGARRDAMAAPIASPATKTATIMLKAYVVGPRIEREQPRPDHLQRQRRKAGDAERRRGHDEAVDRVRSRRSRRIVLSGVSCACPRLDSGAGPTAARRLHPSAQCRSPIGRLISIDSDNRHAPAAAITFISTPTHVAPARPSAGSRTNPAASAPIAAPIVLAAYMTPASRAAACALWMNQREAAGKGRAHGRRGHGEQQQAGDDPQAREGRAAGAVRIRARRGEGSAPRVRRASASARTPIASSRMA